MGLISQATSDTSLLIHPPIPKPLWGINPRNIMGKKKWREVSQRVCKDKLCQACGKQGGKHEAHEVYQYNLKLYRARLVKIVDVCWMCHQVIHWIHNHQTDRHRKLPYDLFNSIQDHAKLLLSDPFLIMSLQFWNEQFYEWNPRWHLRYEGKSYYCDMTQDEWREYYGSE